MLKKLLKYDMREMVRRSTPFFLASGVIALLCCGLMYFSLGFADSEYGFGMITTMSFYGIGIFAIAALFMVSAFFAIMRYYRSFFTDEGYLYMVIPTETGKLLAAKIISAYIWILLSFLVMGASMVLAVAVPNLLYDPKGFFAGLEFFAGVANIYDALLGAFSGTLAIVQFLLSVLENIMVIFTAITIGCIIVRRHKLIGSIAFYFVISLIQSIITGIIEFALTLSILDGDETVYLVGQIVYIIISVAITVVMLFVNLNFLKKRFNIE